TLLDEQETWMRPFIACSDEDRRRFWTEIRKLRGTKPPPAVAKALLESLPSKAESVRFAPRVKGGGSLGRPRFAAIATWRGGGVVREAKALVPSAWTWAHGRTSRPRFLDLAHGAFRSPDPHLAISGGFILRRIAADSRKIDLEDMTGAK